MYTIEFIKGFLSAPRRVASVVPSSKYLAKALSDAALGANGWKPSVVVELGPGTGVVTEAIVERLTTDTTFFAIEIDQDFVQLLQRRFPDVTVYHGSASNILDFLNRSGCSSCDSIISGLPWAAFDDALQDDLLDAVVAALKPGGRFVTFTYVHSPHLPAGRRFRGKLHARFSRVRKTPMIWRNVPPAFAYCAEK